MSKKQKTAGEKAFDFLNALFMILMCCLMLYPFIHVTAIAFSTQAEAIRPGLHFFPPPDKVDFTAIQKVVTAPEIWNAYGNTIFRTVVGTILSVLCTGLGAYAISKKELPLKKPIMGLIVFAMFFSGGLIPDYLLIRNLGLMNSHWAMILPSLVWGFNIMVMKNFFEEIPVSLEESAKLDGANDLLIFSRIYVPLSKPVIATVAMWMAVHHWNAYMDNLLYMNDTSKYVLQRIIRNIVIDAQASHMESMSSSAALSPESMKGATILVSIIPIIMVYPFVQKYFIKGVMIGAVKG